MCLLVIRPKSESWLPSEDEFSNAWESNPHGFGLAYTKKGRIEVRKTLDKAQAWQFVRDLPKGSPALLHWRYMTHGEISPDNCHPFPLANVRGESWVGAHNGVLGKQTCLSGKTDSESYLLTLRSVNVPQIEREVASLGYGKLGFLSQSGQTLIANESQGEWKEGVWRSNSAMEACQWGFPLPRSFGRKATRWERLVCDYCANPAEFQSFEGDLICGTCLDWMEGGAE